MNPHLYHGKDVAVAKMVSSHCQHSDPETHICWRNFFSNLANIKGSDGGTTDYYVTATD